jgi:dUTP pyrophosphatase
MLSRLFEYLYSFIDECTDIRVRLLDVRARKPFKADSGCAGYDVFSLEDVMIAPGERKLVETGVSIQVPRRLYARVAPRSGLSVKGIDIGAGVIDSSYRGPVKILMINNGTENLLLEARSKIAQLILERCSNADIYVVDQLSETERGYGGFGSTGLK